MPLAHALQLNVRRSPASSTDTTTRIADGMRTAGLQSKLEGLEARLAQPDVELAVPAPSPIRLHPNLSELYRRKTGEFAATLADPMSAPRHLMHFAD